MSENEKEPVKENEQAAEGVEALKGIEFEFSENEKTEKASPGDSPPIPAGSKEQEYSNFADEMLKMADDFCNQEGLKPMNPAQKMLIKMGTVGVCIKYNINLENFLKDYPEATLAGGVIWTGYDKVKELKSRKEKAESVPE